jgi:riboflavin synthase
VNLESAMRLGDRLGGHIVAGHVDAMVPIVDIQKQGEAILITIQLLADLEVFVIAKGSIAIDGISLTVARIEEDRCTVSLVGHTMQHTALVGKKLGELVNIECDQFGKYIHKITTATQNNGKSYSKAQTKSVLDMDFLTKQGYGI